MMRISTSMMYQQSLSTMLNQQSELAKTQSEVNTGLRISVPSDDPAGSAQVVALSHILAGNDQYTANMTSANTRLSTESDALNSVTDLLNRANDLALGAINGALSSQDRQNMATELTQIRSQLVQLANSTDGNGQALFAGTSTTKTPFTLNADGSVSYNGNNGQQQTAIGPDLQLPNGDPGSKVFMDLAAGNGSFVAAAGSGNSGTLVVGDNSVTDNAAWASATAGGPVDYTITFTDDQGDWVATTTDADGNQVPLVDDQGNQISGTYQDGGSISINGASLSLSGTPAAGDTVSVQSGTQQDVFSTLTNMIDALQDGSISQADLNNVMNRQLESLNTAQDSVTNTQVEIGGRLDTLTDQQAVYANLGVTYQTALSNVQQVDPATAISNLSLQSTALQASQQVFAKVSSLSLFNYIQ
jgi:flagellar hook-associated protein 3 FlgL